jgi:DNA repair exonuclease SbcCD ATPase subunit
LAAVALGTAQVSAGQGGRGGFTLPMTMEQINQRLEGDTALTAEQKPKVEAANAEFTKKMEEANKKEGVAAAQAEMDKAREARDRDAIQAAMKKLTDARGFDAREEYKKALTPILNEAQLTKLFARGPRGGAAKTQ